MTEDVCTSCACGTPNRNAFLHGASDDQTPPPSSTGHHPIAQATVPGGTFVMGDSSGDANAGDGETPQHSVTLPAFQIDATTVTNEAFAAFVTATGFQTEAERWGFSAVFHLAVTAPSSDILGRAPATPWWIGVKEASWQRPGGAGSDIDDLADHPVVHVSHNDALAYCAWAERRLPTEAEWERAARGAIEMTKYPWGDEEVSEGEWRANIWQGDFPNTNTLADGHLSTAPVRTFAPNGLGVWQAVGNVWEWCADWFDATYYDRSPELDPRGPNRGEQRVLRGGSYLCHDSYCNRYRNSARSQNTPDSSMGNAGFRTVSLRTT